MSKTAIVTGASRGIGFETSKELAGRDNHVIAVARSEESLKLLQEFNPDMIHSVPTDLTDENSVNDLINNIRNDFDGIDILINNAGALVNKPFDKLTMDDWRSQLDINLLSAVNLVKQLLPIFNENAHIVNTSSMGGYQGSSKFPGLSAYSVSKGALSILTECLAVELGDRGIKANALCLGAVQTEMLEKAFPGIKAPVKAEEMGTYIADFALNGSRFYNGKILPVALEDPE